ncbi:MAG: Mrp/NBP35 family ATP-binding protein [Elusimicrobiota bacterium]
MNTGCSQDQTQDKEMLLKFKMSKIKNVFIVMSGKGGVGKTSVAVNLAYALSLQNNKVGILDVDIHGPNIAKMLGIEKDCVVQSEFGIDTIEVTPHLKAMSLALMGVHPDDPIIWRGPIKGNVIKQFLTEVNWGELDYLIIDCPPGTGDETLSVCQLIPNAAGVVIVTTPQDVAILDSRKSVLFAKKLGIPVAGVIENMSGFVCPHCGEKTAIFKEGGGEKAAHDLHVPFLGKIPFEIEIVHSGDTGKPFVLFEKHTESKKAFLEIVNRIISAKVQALS